MQVPVERVCSIIYDLICQHELVESIIILTFSSKHWSDGRRATRTYVRVALVRLRLPGPRRSRFPTSGGYRRSRGARRLIHATIGYIVLHSRAGGANLRHASRRDLAPFTSLHFPSLLFLSCQGPLPRSALHDLLLHRQPFPSPYLVDKRARHVHPPLPVALLSELLPLLHRQRHEERIHR